MAIFVIFCVVLLSEIKMMMMMMSVGKTVHSRPIPTYIVFILNFNDSYCKQESCAIAKMTARCALYK